MDKLSFEIRNAFAAIVTTVGEEAVALPDWPYFCRLVEDLSLTKHWTVRCRAWWRTVPPTKDLFIRDVLAAIGSALQAAELWVQNGNDPSEPVRLQVDALLGKALMVVPPVPDATEARIVA